MNEQQDITEIFRLHNLSERCVNLSKVLSNLHGINSISGLLQYYSNNRTFLKVRRVGNKSNIEICQLCEFYLNKTLLYLTIDSLFVNNEISSESYKYLKERSATSLYKYFSRISKIEFIPKQLQKYFYKYIFDQKLDQKTEATQSVHFNEEKIDYKLLSSIIGVEASKLGFRSQNIAKGLLKKLEKNPQLIFEYQNLEFSKIRNCGRRTALELSNLFRNVFIKYKRIIDINSDLPNSKDYIKINDFEHKFNLESGVFEHWLKDKDLNLQYELPFFALLEFILNETFSKKQKEVFWSFFSLKDTKIPAKTLGKIANKLGLSSERIRQLKKKSFEVYVDLATLLFRFLDRHFVVKKYDISSGKLNVLDIIDEEDLILSPDLIFKGLNFISPNCSLLIVDERMFEYKYLISNHLLEQVDMSGLLSKIQNLLTQKIDHSFELNLKGLIFQYQRNANMTCNINTVISLVEKLIWEEFELQTNLNGNLIIKSNVKKKIYQHIVDVLKNEGKPLHISYIKKEVNKHYKSKPKNDDSIRSQCIRYPNIFINTAWSTYGLKVWEKSGKFKGGSIIDLIIDFLITKENPTHIYQISKEILKHRKTNERSVLGLIDSDKLNRFIKFNSGFVGLVGQHDSYNQNIAKLPGAWFQVFKKRYFIDSNVSIKLYSDIILSESQIYKTTQEHIVVFIERKIDAGKLKIENGNLILT